MRNYPIDYTMSVLVFEPYKKQWIKRKVILGRYLSKDAAIEQGFAELLTLGFNQWKNLIITNEYNKIVYSCDGSPSVA